MGYTYSPRTLEGKEAGGHRVPSQRGYLQVSLDNSKRPCPKGKFTYVPCIFLGVYASYACICTCEGWQRPERTSNIFFYDPQGTPDNHSG